MRAARLLNIPISDLDGVNVRRQRRQEEDDQTPPPDRSPNSPPCHRLSLQCSMRTQRPDTTSVTPSGIVTDDLR